jgi:hypothetical protein
MRTFLTTYVRIKRQRSEYNEYGEMVPTFDSVYAGKALVRPAGGTTEGYGLGTVENYKLVVLINGTFNIRQADIVTINDGREYEVMYPPVFFESYTELRLDQRSQIEQPT